jgi:hypothetical protein
MRRTGKDADGYDRTGRRGDTYLAAREAGWSVQAIAGRFNPHFSQPLVTAV